MLLLKAGIALDHGKFVPGRYFESDLSEQEIHAAEQMGFRVSIEIRDMESYYANPDRPSMFATGEFENRKNNCSDFTYNYKTPANYFDGTMGGYFTYDEMIFILDWMKVLYPNLISKTDTIKGYKTQDGNVINFIKISDNADKNEADEPQVLYTALHHAREPNSLSQMIFYMWYLLENYNSNPEIKYLVDHTELYFIPCINPDGYKLNQKEKPKGGGLWRKNTKKDGTGKVVGVDLNRNYGYEWAHDSDGSSSNPGSETYRGSAPFSEAETSAVRALCRSHKFMVALNYHTFGNYLIHPWGFNDQVTSEDALFKSLGKTMNKENNFLMGTGSETVGYVVNGDSDDYLYGDVTEKNKIYAFTSEVGPSFWPSPKDIDFLNKSCLQMNLALPRLVNSFLDHELVDRISQYNVKDTLLIKFVKASFVKKAINVKMYLAPSYGANNVSNVKVDLDQTKSMTASLPFILDEKKLAIGKNDIKVYIEKNYGDFTSKDSIIINVYYGKREILFSDDASTITNWKSVNGAWNITALEAYTKPTCITDSPSTNYQRARKTTLKLATGLDLSKTKSPVLSFYTKWNIESTFDYASVYAFTPGGDTTRLCGKYTKSGLATGVVNEPIYDGEQSTWVNEAMSLAEFEGKNNVFINIELVSDAFLEMDGIYLDDIKVVYYDKIISAATDENQETISIYPNPTSGHINVYGIQNGILEIYDINGRKLYKNNLFGQSIVDLSHLGNGIYFAKIIEDHKVIQRSKLIIAN
jgi:carboxypeptidase T